MEIVAINVKPTKPSKNMKKSVCIVRMTQAEARLTIQSLITQIIEQNQNAGRYEHFDINGCDFSIAVMPEENITQTTPKWK